MARSKPAKTLKISVPRHNAQRIGPSLTAEIHSLARQESILVQLPPPVQEQPSSAGPSAVRIFKAIHSRSVYPLTMI